MSTVYLESDDGIRLPLLDVDDDDGMLAATVEQLAGSGPTITARPNGAQVASSGSQSRTDFADPEIAAVRTVVEAAITEAGLRVASGEFFQSVVGFVTLDEVEFTKLTVGNGGSWRLGEFHADHNQKDHGNRAGRYGGDRTGIPEIDSVIEAFLNEPQGDWTTDDSRIGDLQDCHGICQEVAWQFVEFAKARGLEKVYATNTDLVELGYEIQPGSEGGEIGFDENDVMQYGHYPEHTVNTIYPSGSDIYTLPIVVDFTARQYGYDTPVKVSLAGDTAAFHLDHNQKDHGNRYTAPRSATGWRSEKHLTTPDLGYTPTGRPIPVESREVRAKRRKIEAGQRRVRNQLRHRVLPSSEDMDSKAGELFGKGNSPRFFDEAADVLFKGADQTVVPFRSASRLKGEPLYDRDLVNAHMSGNTILREIDPRALHASQRGVTRAGVIHYLTPEWQRSGRLFADQHQPGNQHPIVWRNPRSGQNVLLSGHHRATAALLQGRALEVIYVDPEHPTPARRVAQLSTMEAMSYRDVTGLLAIDEDADPETLSSVMDAVRSLMDGAPATVADDESAVKVLTMLAVPDDEARTRVAFAAGRLTGPVEQFHLAVPDDEARIRLPVEQFHLKGTANDHDQSTHARGGGAKKGPDVGPAAVSLSPNDFGKSIPLPTIAELMSYDPVPATPDLNEQLLLRFMDDMGNLEEDRELVHDQLVADALVDPKTGKLYPAQPEGQRKALIMGGGAASGKSTAIDRGFVDQPGDAATINPDEFKVKLPEAAGKTKQGKDGNGLAEQFPEEWAAIAHEESSHLGKRTVLGATAATMNMVIDKTSSKGPKAVRQIKALQAAGYEVSQAYVTTEVDRAVAAARARGEEKGRFVDPDVLRNGHDGANLAFLEVARDTSGVDLKLVTTYPKNPDGSYPEPVLTAVQTGQGRLEVQSRTAWEEYTARLQDPSMLDDLDITFAG